VIKKVALNTKLIVPTLGVAALALVSAAGLKAVRAESDSSPPFVQKLAERFGLNEDEVQSFFDEQRQERWQEMENLRSERLNQAVEDGAITEEQKQALIDKWQEVQTEKDQHREEMQNWFQEQGIDETTLMPYIGYGPHGGLHYHRMGN
jgi:hypothetical protein